MRAIPYLLLLLMLPSEPGSAQCNFSYLGLQVGASTQADVERQLGAPVQVYTSPDIDRGKFEFAPQPGTGPIFVSYNDSNGIVNNITVASPEPVDRAAVAARLGLDGSETVGQGILRVRGSGPRRMHSIRSSCGVVNLFFSGPDESSGVISVQFLGSAALRKGGGTPSSSQPVSPDRAPTVNAGPEGLMSSLQARMGSIGPVDYTAYVHWNNGQDTTIRWRAERSNVRVANCRVDAHSAQWREGRLDQETEAFFLFQGVQDVEVVSMLEVLRALNTANPVTITRVDPPVSVVRVSLVNGKQQEIIVPNGSQATRLSADILKAVDLCRSANNGQF